MASIAAELARRLAARAEAVCRHYLSSGRREGPCWRVGDIANRPGRSLFVNLSDQGAGVAGRWADMATGQHGDLLDLIAARCGLARFADIAAEAEAFLGQAPPPPAERRGRVPPDAIERRRSIDLARRIFASGRPIAGTLVERYLRGRGLAPPAHAEALRFHPRCLHRPNGEGPSVVKPALLAAATDGDGAVTGLHRTWLSRAADGRVTRLDRRALGRLLGAAVRFGAAREVWAVGEGLETVLSLQAVAPGLPTAAALSAAHLRAVALPPGLTRLYVVCDNDPAGHSAARDLADRASAQGVLAIVLAPRLGDLNEDLARLGHAGLSASIRAQLHPSDRDRLA